MNTTTSKAGAGSPGPIGLKPDHGYASPTEETLSRRLAEERQQLSHEGVHNPTWAELTRDEQVSGALSARNYLRAAARIGLLADPAELERLADEHADDTEV